MSSILLSTSELNKNHHSEVTEEVYIDFKIVYYCTDRENVQAYNNDENRKK